MEVSDDLRKKTKPPARTLFRVHAGGIDLRSPADCRPPPADCLSRFAVHGRPATQCKSSTAGTPSGCCAVGRHLLGPASGQTVAPPNSAPAYQHFRLPTWPD